MNGSSPRAHQKSVAQVKVAVLADRQRQHQLFSPRPSELFSGLAALASACSLYLLVR